MHNYLLITCEKKKQYIQNKNAKDFQNIYALWTTKNTPTLMKIDKTRKRYKKQ